jgi:hypothetical protein
MGNNSIRGARTWAAGANEAIRAKVAAAAMSQPLARSLTRSPQLQTIFRLVA